MSWLMRRLFNEKNVGYLYQIVRPIIQEDLGEMAKEAVIELLQDEEVATGVASYADAIVDREKKRVFGTIGGLQKGINYAAPPQGGGGGLPDFDIVDEDGNISLSKGIHWYLKNRSKLGSGGGIGGFRSPQSGSGAQNAPD